MTPGHLIVAVFLASLAGTLAAFIVSFLTAAVILHARRRRQERQVPRGAEQHLKRGAA